MLRSAKDGLDDIITIVKAIFQSLLYLVKNFFQMTWKPIVRLVLFVILITFVSYLGGVYSTLLTLYDFPVYLNYLNKLEIINWSILTAEKAKESMPLVLAFIASFIALSGTVMFADYHNVFIMKSPEGGE